MIDYEYLWDCFFAVKNAEKGLPFVDSALRDALSDLEDALDKLN